MQRAYAHGASTHALIGETIGDRFERTVRANRDGEALVVREQDIRLTYSELNYMVDRLARALLNAGLEVGDRLGIWAPNCAEWVIVQFATAKLGVILVNINPAYRTSELEYALRQSGCRFVIAASSFKGTSFTTMLDEVWHALPELERVVYLDADQWDDLLSQGEAVPIDHLQKRMATLEFDDPINIQYTSGTTGFPKGATLSHHNILNNGYFVGQHMRYTEVDRVCIAVPFYHCFGMVLGNLACITHGATMVIPGVGFDPVQVLETVAEERCTSLYGVPTMFIAELNHPDFGRYDLASLRTGIMAGSPCPIEVMKRVVCEMKMEEVTICYGMTETSPVSTQTSLEDSLARRVTTVGRVHPHLEIKIVDPTNGRTVVRGQAGELLTRGYSVMLGYWNDPDQTAEVIDRARWMHTGDLATMDAEGYINIVGRSKDVIIRGGENVYPREVEEFLYSHPDVVDVQVIGVPDAHYGEEVMAWVKLRAGARLEDVEAFCRNGIARFKNPRYWKVVDEFPMTVTGKVQKFRMREMAVQELGLADERSETA
jgi:fatty-acyl-CoA synthase